MSGYGVGSTTYYIMRAVDPDCQTSPPTYRTWAVPGRPDYTGAYYTGPRCGSNPLTSVIVADTITADDPLVPELSPILWILGAGNPNATGGSFTVGVEAYFTKAVVVHGVRFFPPVASKTIRASMWTTSGLVTSVDLAVGPLKTYEAIFATPQDVPPFAVRRFSQWQTDGGSYAVQSNASLQSLPALPFLSSPSIVWRSMNNFVAGDANPSSTSASERYPVEPIYSIR